MTNHKNAEAVRALLDSGARMVECQGKRANKLDWQVRKINDEVKQEIIDWVSDDNDDHNVGFVPHSAGMMVIDLDNGSVDEVKAIEEFSSPLVEIQSPSGGWHLYYELAQGDSEAVVANGNWAVGDSNGQIRCSNGYVVLWSPMAVVEALSNERGSAVSAAEIDSIRKAKSGPTKSKAFRPMSVDPDIAASALMAIECSSVLGDDWVHISMAVKAAGVAFETWDTWNKSDTARYNLAENLERWDSFSDGGGIGPGTLFYHARKDGWEAPSKRLATVKAKDSATLEFALGLIGIQIRFNTRSRRVEYTGEDRSWSELDSRADAKIRERIKETVYVEVIDGRKKGDEIDVVPLKWSEQDWKLTLNALLYENEVDPFAEWLSSLPPWDNSSRLDDLLETMFGAEGSPLGKWASSATIIGAVHRTLNPGAKIDETPVLIGPQGIGKSTFPKALFPPGQQDRWFADEVDFGTDTKKRVEATLGRVIVEAAELQNLRGSDISKVKSYMTRTDDGSIRLSFDPRPEPLERRFVFLGSANADEEGEAVLPNDPTGNRRWVSVFCPTNKVGAIESFIGNQRAQLWAEAKHRQANGETGRLPRGLFEHQVLVNKQWRSDDHRLADATTYIQAWQFADGGGVTELIASVGGDKHDVSDKRNIARHMLEKAHFNAIGSELRSAGWVSRRVRIDGKQMRHWFAPRDVVEATRPPGELPYTDIADGADEHEGQIGKFRKCEACSNVEGRNIVYLGTACTHPTHTKAG